LDDDDDGDDDDDDDDDDDHRLLPSRSYEMHVWVDFVAQHLVPVKSKYVVYPVGAHLGITRVST